MKRAKSLTRLTVAFGFALLFGLAACKKEISKSEPVSEEDQEITASTVESEAEADVVFEDVFDNVLGVNEDVGFGGTGVFMRSADARDPQPCFTVAVTKLNAPDLFPLKVVTDFGDGCTVHGRTRKGKIITVYTGRLTVPGKKATTTFDGYSVDGIKVEGTHVIANTGSAGDRRFVVEVVAKITKPNGNYSEWTSRRVITQVEGADTPKPGDDVFRIEGGAKGQWKRGERTINWESTITEPLRKRFTCRWISKGIVRIKGETSPSGSVWEATLNYGNGECDNKAVLTINGKDREITLR